MVNSDSLLIQHYGNIGHGEFKGENTVKLKIGSYEVFVPHMGDFSQTSSEPLVYS